jgi:hypothetical protein
MKAMKALGFLIVLFFASFASAQTLDFKVQAGSGYANVEAADYSNLFAQAYVGGISWGRISGGAIYELNYVAGFNQRVYARGEVKVVGPTYAAVDTAVNGDWDPRAVFGLNFRDFVIEGYGRIDGDALYGVSVRYKFPF